MNSVTKRLSKCEEKGKTFSNTQEVRNFTSNAPFLNKLLEDVLQKNKGGKSDEDVEHRKGIRNQVPWAAGLGGNKSGLRRTEGCEGCLLAPNGTDR